MTKEQNNVDKASTSSAQSLEIQNLKHTLFEHLKEKESLEQKVTLLKNDFQKEESRNIDRELALEKQVKELNNIVFKRNQSAQIVHMLTKPQFFYDHSTRQALGFQNPCYLKKAQQLEPKLYDGSVIQKTDAIVICDSEETLMLEHESRSKMLQKQKDPMMSEKKTELSAEQAFWSQNSGNSEEPNLSTSTTIVEVPKELPKVSMVNSSLKKLKFHLASFDMVFNERTTATTITEGEWGFEHTNACFRDEIIPIVKALKELFNSFDQFLIDELTKVQNIFNQIEQAVEQHCVEKNKFQDKIKDVLKENKRLLEQAMSTDIVNIVVNANVNYAFQEKDTDIMKLKERIKSLCGNVKEEKIKRELEEIETINIELDHRVTNLVAENEHLKQIYKQLYDSIKSSRVRSKEQSLKDTLRKLKGKAMINEVVPLHSINPELLKIDVAPLAPKLCNNMTAHNDYLKHTQKETATLREIVKNKRLLNPLNTSLDYACKYTKCIQELLIILKQTCPCINDLGTELMAMTPKNNNKNIRFTEHIPSSGNTPIKTTSSTNIVSNKPVLSSTGVNLLTSASGSQPQGNTKKDRIQRTQSRAKKNKLENHPRKVRPSLLNKKSVVNTKAISYVPNSKLNVNSDLKCATCNGCLFSNNHDSCVLEFINSVNARVKSKSVKKPVNRKIWQPTGKMFTTIGHKWRPTGWTFTLVGNVCPLTRITTTAIVPLKKPIPIETHQLHTEILGTVKFKNGHVAKIMGYGDYNIRNVTILRVYFVEGLGHNLFSVGQFCDSHLEVAFREHTCFIRNLDGVDLLTGSRGNNLYTLSLQDMMASSPICRLSKASKTKSWIWHRRLSHLNFGAINHLARQGLVRGAVKISSRSHVVIPPSFKQTYQTHHTAYTPSLVSSMTQLELLPLQIIQNISLVWSLHFLQLSAREVDHSQRIQRSFIHAVYSTYTALFCFSTNHTYPSPTLVDDCQHPKESLCQQDLPF
nr:integrase, catalytic region, zinc finger, CCHC-type, peptidase aspartic, catalytic [Tanacetum cinerariifolium]